MKCKFRCSYPELIHLSLPDHGDSDTEEDSINYRHFRDYLSIAIYMYLKWSFMIYSGWWTVLTSNCTFKKSSLWPNRARLLYHTRIHIALTQLVIIQAQKETRLGRAPYPWIAPCPRNPPASAAGKAGTQPSSPVPVAAYSLSAAGGSTAPPTCSSPQPEAVAAPANAAAGSAAAVWFWVGRTRKK